MSLLGFAIIGKNNEPLYLCDCVRATQEEINKQVSEDYDNKESGQSGDNDIFLGQSLSFENQIIIHSALDQFEELVETLGSSLPVIRRRNNTNRSSRPSNKDPRWVGVRICSCLVFSLSLMLVFSEVTHILLACLHRSSALLMTKIEKFMAT